MRSSPIKIFLFEEEGAEGGRRCWLLLLYDFIDKLNSSSLDDCDFAISLVKWMGELSRRDWFQQKLSSLRDPHLKFLRNFRKPEGDPHLILLRSIRKPEGGAVSKRLISTKALLFEGAVSKRLRVSAA
jgi:hypothetical protein